MNCRMIAWTVALCWWVAVPQPVALGSDDGVGKLLEMMPANHPVSFVIPNMQKLDKSITRLKQRFSPGGEDVSIMAQIKKDVGVAQWVAFDQPIGVAIPSVGGAGQEGVFWMKVAGFSTKAKAVEGGSETDGVWELPFEKSDTLFAKVVGDYVVAASSKEVLAAATAKGESLAKALGSDVALLRGRDVLIHVSVDPVRQMCLGKLAQVAQMAPMFIMMGMQQSGGDPAAVMGALNSVLDAVKGLVEQVDQVNVAIGLTDEAANITLATSYNEGPIKSYLAEQKPAGASVLAGLEEQPYLLALGYHMPGPDSPFLDYLFGNMLAAIDAAPATTSEGGAVEAVDKAASLKDALVVFRDMYRKMEGQNAAMAMSPGGMRVVGNYATKDPPGLIELVKKSMSMANPLMNQVKSGGTYEATGSRDVGGVKVDMFRLKVDTSDSGAAQLVAMYGTDPRFALGATETGVRFFMGSEAQLEHAFRTKVSKPFAAGKYASASLAALPAKRNMVVLFDPATAMATFGAMSGKPQTEGVPPGPPVAICVSLSGEPARVDIHVPLRAIERAMQASGADEPM